MNFRHCFFKVAALLGGNMNYFVGGESRVNIFSTNDQQAVTSAALSGGGYVSIWQSNGQNGSGNGLVGQLYNDLGQRVGATFFIETTTIGEQIDPTVAATTDGGFVVAWDGAGTAEIFAQKFDATGSPVGGETLVNTETYSTQYQPTVAELPGGGYVVAWTSTNDENFTQDIRFQRFDASSAPVGAETTVNTTTAGNQYQPAIAATTTGFVVVWTDQSPSDGSLWGVYAQRYDASGVAQGAETLVNTTTTGYQWEPAVVGLNGGGYVVVWSSQNVDASGYTIVAQIYDAAGVAQGGEIQINQSTIGDQDQPSVTATSDGGFFVSWSGDYNDAVPGYTYDIFGRQFASDGTPTSNEFVVNQGSINQPSYSSAVGLSNGAVAVSWQAGPQDGDGSGQAVMQRLLDPTMSGIVAPVPPILEGVAGSVTYDEAVLNAGAQLIDSTGAAAVSAGGAVFRAGPRRA